jgi:GT2 family glycosyltransferase
VIVVVNSPDVNLSCQFQKLVGLYENHLYIRIPQYAGYVAPCNMGAGLSRGDYICILNDDIVAGRGWADSMISELEKDDTLGQVGPSLAYLDKNFGFTPVKTTRPYLEGWCFIIPRRVYSEIGLFDPDIDFAYCEDSDFSTTVIHKGYKVKQVKSAILHLGTQTSKSCGTMQTFTDGCEEKNKIYLQKKWGTGDE